MSYRLHPIERIGVAICVLLYLFLFHGLYEHYMMWGNIIPLRHGIADLTTLLIVYFVVRTLYIWIRNGFKKRNGDVK